MVWRPAASGSADDVRDPDRRPAQRHQPHGGPRQQSIAVGRAGGMARHGFAQAQVPGRDDGGDDGGAAAGEGGCGHGNVSLRLERSVTGTP
jgi:hypothetical protein